MLGINSSRGTVYRASRVVWPQTQRQTRNICSHRKRQFTFDGSRIQCNLVRHHQLPGQPHRTISSTSSRRISELESSQSLKKRKLASRDRGPISKEATQTDFAQLNVYANTANPTTSVDICTSDGFILDSGLCISDGDGVVLTGSEAFVWRPWMAGAHGERVVTGMMMRQGGDVSARTGGVVNLKGQFEVAGEAWGVFASLWPRPDLLIIGTGGQIRPLAPATRKALEQLGMKIEVLDTRNAASQFNLLATERGVTEVAAAMMPVGFGER